VPDPQIAGRARFCSQCGQPIVVEGASFCKDCGAPLEATSIIRRDLGLRPLIAFSLSLIPGLGHVYQGHPWRGILWFFGVGIGYGSSLGLGFILHLICAANAALYGTIREEAWQRRRHHRRRSGGMSATFRP
jgi:hypothetical protein